MTERASAVVDARALTRAFGPTTAVRHLSFTVESGTLFGIVGPDGAGKTTTLRMLAGILPPTEGDADVLGVPVARTPEAAKQRLAYMPQKFGLYEDLTVRENLDFYADLHRVPRAARPERRARLFAFSRLGAFEGRLAGALSGGMKQKLALSCALIHEPELLLLDEPTFGVDPVSRRELWRILHEMVARGTTIVVSTSYLDEAERCDRVLVMDRGRARARGTPAELLAGFPGVVISLRTSAPRRDRDAVERHPLVRHAALFGDTLHVIVADVAAWDRIHADLDSKGMDVLEAAPTPPRLEDVFLDLVAAEAER